MLPSGHVATSLYRKSKSMHLKKVMVPIFQQGQNVSCTVDDLIRKCSGLLSNGPCEGRNLGGIVCVAEVHLSPNPLSDPA